MISNQTEPLDDIESLSGNLNQGGVPSKGYQYMDMKQRLMSLNLSGPVAAEWFQRRRQNIRPWSVFLNTSRFRSPINASLFPLRIAKNLDHFQSNYVFVFLGLVAYCFITSPLLLMTMAATAGACYIVRIKNENQIIRIFGHELTLIQQYALVVVAAIPFFIYAGAGSAVFWIIGASFVLIMLHASFFAVETLNLPDDEITFTTPLETV